MLELKKDNHLHPPVFELHLYKFVCTHDIRGRIVYPIMFKPVLLDWAPPCFLGLIKQWVFFFTVVWRGYWILHWVNDICSIIIIAIMNINNIILLNLAKTIENFGYQHSQRALFELPWLKNKQNPRWSSKKNTWMTKVFNDLGNAFNSLWWQKITCTDLAGFPDTISKTWDNLMQILT